MDMNRRLAVSACASLGFMAVESLCYASMGGGESSVVASWNPVSFLSAALAIESVVLVFLCSYIWKKRKGSKRVKQNTMLFKDMFDLAPYSCVLTDFSGRYIMVNQAYCNRLEVTQEEIIGRTMNEIEVKADAESVQEIKRQLMEKGEVKNVEIMLTLKSGAVIYSLFSSRIIEYNGEKVVLSMTVDITDRKRFEQELLERDRRLVIQNEQLQGLLISGKLLLRDFMGAICEITKTGSLLLETERVSVWIYSDDYQLLRCVDLYNSVTRNHSSGDELQSADFPVYTDAHRQGVIVVAADVYTDPRTCDIPEAYLKENDIQSLLDVPIWLGDRMRGVLSFESTGNKKIWSKEDERIAQTLATFVTLGFEIDERKRSEDEREKLQSQLLQSQKMEAVGRLAGGVAHDFNNMLTVIIGHSEIAAMRESLTDELIADLEQIKSAARKSADLTGQLLAFARKQTIDPRVLDLNATVAEMISMLRRLIGEDIDLAWMPGESVWPVFIDPTQIDQILVNLCVNARDAISGVGKIVIETQNVTFDKTYCEDNLGFIEGSYIMLAVSDDGCGMSREHLANIFEPFFTTKDKGKGTGLGLATLFGIVKQNNGFVNAYSEPGKGTTLRLYFPKSFEEVVEPLFVENRKAMEGKGELILMVEDEPVILEMGKIILEKLGYRVISASTPDIALHFAQQHAADIRLLMTDVVMPGMNGKELSEKIMTLNPRIRCLYMSGYTANAIVHRGVLDKGVHFIQKPFSVRTLSTKIREVLDSD